MPLDHFHSLSLEPAGTLIEFVTFASLAFTTLDICLMVPQDAGAE